MKNRVLKHIRSFVTPELTDYSTKRFFTRGTNGWGVNFRSFNPTFKVVFIDSSEMAKAEVIASTTIEQHDLIRDCRFGLIYAELGRLDSALTIDRLAALLASHPEQRGNDWLIAPVVDPYDPNKVWAVSCLWRDSCWLVGANPLSDPLGWSAGYRVFSRDSKPSDPL